MKPDVRKAALAEGIKPGIRPEVMLIDLDKGFFSNSLHSYYSDQQALDNSNSRYINWILKDLHQYLVDKSKRPKSKKRYRYRGGSNITKWGGGLA